MAGWPAAFAPAAGEDRAGARRRRRRARASASAAATSDAPCRPLPREEAALLPVPCPGGLVLALPRTGAALRRAAQLLRAAASLTPASAYDLVTSGALAAAAAAVVSWSARDGVPAEPADGAAAAAEAPGVTGAACSACLCLLATALKQPAHEGAVQAAASLALRRLAVRVLVPAAAAEGSTVFDRALHKAVAVSAHAHATQPELPEPVQLAAEAAADIIAAVAEPAIAKQEGAAVLAVQRLVDGEVPEAAAAAAGMAGAAGAGDARPSRGLVPALCRLVATLFARSLLDPESLSGPVGQKATGALAALSAHEVARAGFAVRVGRQVADAARAAAAAGSAASGAAAAGSSPVLRPLLDLLRLPLEPSEGWDVVRGNALAALSNAALSGTGSARAMVDSAAVGSLLDFIDGRAVLPEASAAAKAAPGGSAVADRLLRVMAEAAGGGGPGVVELGEVSAAVRGRAAALLSRLAADEVGAAQLATPEVAARVTGLLVRMSGVKPPGTGGRAPKASKRAVDEDTARTQDALVRCLAGAVSGTGGRGAFVRAGGLHAMAAILRTRGDAAAVKARANGLGNLARIAIQLASVPGEAGAAVCEQLAARGVVDGLLGVVKEVGEHPARKNAAVALAKMAKVHSSCAERLRELDGIKVLLSLGKELG